ncbi:MAG: dUTP diphosphatase [Firmicutes bacterium HGW-Firmicutes-13]|nr:MAG: dUTP diphosphatase [Firmicutes bacterium HGW-Firmicutes-13]
MDKVVVKVLKMGEAEDLPLPEYSSLGSSGLDLRAAVEQEIIINSGECELIPTGIKIALPENYEGQVRPRSGLALKYGITVLNTPGTIDSDYRGEVKIILINFGKRPYTVKRGDRIAQLVISYVPKVEIVQVKELSGTLRGKGGFGHSGI